MTNTFKFLSAGLLLSTAVPMSADTVNIALLGDSITEGFVDENNNGELDSLDGNPFENQVTDRQLQTGYRQAFASVLDFFGVDYDLVGSQTNGAVDGQGTPLVDPDHLGFGGRQVQTVNDRFNEFVATAPASQTPEAAVLLLGVNDLLQGRSVSQTFDRLNNLVDDVLGVVGDDGTVFVSTILDLAPFDDAFYNSGALVGLAADTQPDVDAYNTLIRDAFEAGGVFAADERIVLVEGNLAVSASQSTLPDGLHPSTFAYTDLGLALGDAVAVTLIPEPGTAAAAAFGLGVLGLRRRSARIR